MRLVDYASHVGNIYTKTFSFSYLSNVLQKKRVDHVLTHAEYQAAIDWINSQDVLVLLTQDLNTGVALNLLSDFVGAHFTMPTERLNHHVVANKPANYDEKNAMRTLLTWDINLFVAASRRRDNLLRRRLSMNMNKN